jgi:hypothetical protein
VVVALSLPQSPPRGRFGTVTLKYYIIFHSFIFHSYHYINTKKYDLLSLLRSHDYNVGEESACGGGGGIIAVYKGDRRRRVLY